ncbi:GNAT family N-acetyltransferase [Reichenbachiella agarivorans]|uniref:GNAT family N-acetyltransferase n=1 Tax=Reichenbachiella agarivorans TaxID=2979464 RepID=A0ABY6CMM1_9BACT|nr:GNAT family N-acetyltransferase [Reichenbachiella agarivorans]UXP31315.1 GNAT family N-acetyltransferase [Reichenbachiella agarivorans]
MLHIRKATEKDLALIQSIEESSFPVFQRSNLRTLRLSLSSANQEVWVYEDENKETAGVLILHLHKRTLRIFSIGVKETHQGQGIGTSLLTHACNLALTYGNYKVSLEASVTNEKLIKWYQNAGFVITENLDNYYCEGESAVRMVFEIPGAKTKTETENIVVVDKPSDFKFDIDSIKIVSAKNYISNQEFHNIKNARIYNLCNSYSYQSIGYYVSLLASARDHRVMPSVSTIRDFNSTQITRSVTYELGEVIQETLSKHKETEYNLLVYYGQTNKTGFKKLAHQLFQVFESPIIRIKFTKADKWLIQKVSPMRVSSLTEEELQLLYRFSKDYFSRKRFHKTKSKQYKYDLAILVNPTEATPPSGPQALRAFKKSAEKYGFCVEFITKEDIDRISEFDALFIRETTNAKDHTYLMSRLAYAEGLVVIDDPWSILRCSNKIFQNEKLKQHNVLTPATQILVKGVFKPEHANGMNFPVVLKQPDSAFSLGVSKANNKEELISQMALLFKNSDLVVAQEFLYSDYDWRIGVLDQSPLFACKYYMSKDHWQVYNWEVNKNDTGGNAEILELKDVPPKVIKTALKAASLMGDGLYGVDLKMVNGKVYVIEVNDNPNIDVGCEDLIMGDELYDRLIHSILTRIEVSRNIKSPVMSLYSDR